MLQAGDCHKPQANLSSQDFMYYVSFISWGSTKNQEETLAVTGPHVSQKTCFSLCHSAQVSLVVRGSLSAPHTPVQLYCALWHLSEHTLILYCLLRVLLGVEA